MFRVMRVPSRASVSTGQTDAANRVKPDSSPAHSLGKQPMKSGLRFSWRVRALVRRAVSLPFFSWW